MLDEITKLEKDTVVNLVGLVADGLPTDVGTGSTVLQLDGDQKAWVYSKENINPVTGDGWWEVV